MLLSILNRKNTKWWFLISALSAISFIAVGYKTRLFALQNNTGNGEWNFLINVHWVVLFILITITLVSLSIFVPGLSVRKLSLLRNKKRFRNVFIVWMLIVFLFTILGITAALVANTEFDVLTQFIVVGSIILSVVGIMFYIFLFTESFNKEKTSKGRSTGKSEHSFFKVVFAFFIACCLSFLYLLLTLPFLQEAGGLPFGEMARVGGRNMWRVVGIYGLLTIITNLITWNKGFLKFTGFSIILFWLIGTTIVGTVSLMGLAKTSEDMEAVRRAVCDKDASLEHAKGCTFIVTTDVGHGTGFSVKNGFLVTNFHVIEGANKITTWVDDGTGENEYNLSLWNYSEVADLAVLKFPESVNRIRICEWANAESMRLAEQVFAIGWPLITEGESSITQGIYSRTMETEQGPIFLQTDTPINPGNSGGPLISSCGIVGVNTLKLSWADEYNPAEGFGFAISSEYAESRVEEMTSSGYVHALPVGSTAQVEYKPTEEYYQQHYNTDNIQTINWAKTETDKLYDYWFGKDVNKYDTSTVQVIQDYIYKMRGIIDVVYSKVINNSLLSNEDIANLDNWMNYYDRVKELERDSDVLSNDYHYECSNGTCVEVSGKGKNECTTYYDCQPKYHFECKDKKCVEVKGDGDDGFFWDGDCYYSECDDGKCVEVEGDGEDECYGDYACVHNECDGDKCVEVDEPGTDECYSDWWCENN